MRATSSSGVTRSLPGGSSQSRRHTPSGSGRRGDLPARGSGRPPRRHPVKQRLTGPRKFRTQCGHGVSLHRRTAGEADVLEFAHGGARAVAADQVTAAPPCALGAAGVGRDAGGLLLDGVQAAVHGDLDEPLAAMAVAQGAGQYVLGDVQGGGVRDALAPVASSSAASSKAISRITCLRRIDRHPAQWTPAPASGHTGQPFQQGGGVLAQHDGAREARGSSLPGPSSRTTDGTSWRASARASVSPTGPAPTMITGSTARRPLPGAASSRDASEQEVGAGCTITERMQPIAGCLRQADGGSGAARHCLRGRSCHLTVAKRRRRCRTRPAAASPKSAAGSPPRRSPPTSSGGRAPRPSTSCRAAACSPASSRSW